MAGQRPGLLCLKERPFAAALTPGPHSERDCSISAASSSGGRGFPLRLARFNIPAHAFADKEYFWCGVSSKICDKRDSTSTLGHSPKLRIENSVSD